MTYVKKQLTLIKCNVCISSLIIKGKANAQKETKKKWEKQNTHTQKCDRIQTHEIGCKRCQTLFSFDLIFQIDSCCFFRSVQFN